MKGHQTATFNSKELLEPKHMILAKPLPRTSWSLPVSHFPHPAEEPRPDRAASRESPCTPASSSEKCTWETNRWRDLFLDLHNARACEPQTQPFEYNGSNMIKDNVQYFNIGTILRLFRIHPIKVGTIKCTSYLFTGLVLFPLFHHLNPFFLSFDLLEFVLETEHTEF